tara:strand:+ start:3663 stop:4079 length:417 start_codon:yes stop_codon:yes gene_type:complete
MENINLLTTSKIPSFNGLAFPVVRGLGGFFTKTDGVQTTMSGLKQLLLTSKGERVMRPDFGTSLRASVFEQMTESKITNLRQELSSAIRKYHPEVDILKLDVSWNSTTQASSRNSLLVTLDFQLIGEHYTPQTLNIVI